MKRRIIVDLHPAPLDRLSLPAALREHVEPWSRISGIAANVQVAEPMPSLPKEPHSRCFASPRNR